MLGRWTLLVGNVPFEEVKCAPGASDPAAHPPYSVHARVLGALGDAREMREPEWQATHKGSPALCCSGDDRLCLSPAVRVSKAPRTRVQLLCAPRDVSKSSPDANPSESSPCPVRPGEHILPVLSVRVSREGTYFSQTSSTDPKEQVRVRVRLVLCTRALCVAFCWFVRRQSMILSLICRANTPRQYLC